MAERPGFGKGRGCAGELAEPCSSRPGASRVARRHGPRIGAQDPSHARAGPIALGKNGRPTAHAAGVARPLEPA